jgi:hypothetical protein
LLMKKVIVLFLSIAIAGMLVACGGTDGAEPSQAPEETADVSENTSAQPADSVEPSPEASVSEQSEIGFFDPNVDYTQNKQYKVRIRLQSGWVQAKQVGHFRFLHRRIVESSAGHISMSPLHARLITSAE